MTTTDMAGLPAAITDRLYAIRKPQETACDEANMARTTYYRRLEHPGGFKLHELERLAATMGCTLRVELAPLPVAPVRAGSAEDRVVPSSAGTGE